jgi:aryl-alcohol dehydrogenase-like predicted oxidoreductase
VLYQTCLCRLRHAGQGNSSKPEDLKAQVRENLQHLGLETLEVVNLRTASHEGGSNDSIAEQFGALAELRRQGLIRHLGLVLIPGTSSLAHLRENIAAADLVLPADAVAELDAIAR